MSSQDASAFGLFLAMERNPRKASMWLFAVPRGERKNDHSNGMAGSAACRML